VLEFVPGGGLSKLLAKYHTFDEYRTRCLLRELISAVGHIHALGYIHRDLKPDNILLDAWGHLKLIDLGLCKKCVDRNQKAVSVVGTFDYMAPEILLRSGYCKI
jgi:serine/threonine protein kinase